LELEKDGGGGGGGGGGWVTEARLCSISRWSIAPFSLIGVRCDFQTWHDNRK